MKYYGVTSSNVKRLGYDAETKTVQVEFGKPEGPVTGVYEYYPIPESTFDDILNAPSVGSAVSKRLVKGGPGIERRKIS